MGIKEDPTEAGYRRVKRLLREGRLHEYWHDIPMWPYYLIAFIILNVWILLAQIFWK